MSKEYYKGFYQNDGVVFVEEKTSPAMLDRLKTLSFEPEDVLLATYPRSGTTWTSYILYLINNNVPGNLLSKPYLIQEMPLLELNLGRPVADHIRELVDRPAPRLSCTHLQRQFLSVSKDRPKVVVVFRNPKDTLVSYYHFYRMANSLGPFEGTWDDFFRMFKDNKLQGGDVLDFCSSWWLARNEANILILTYEEMKRDTAKAIGRMANFCNKSLTDQQVQKILEKTSLPEMKENPATNFQHLTEAGFFDQSKAPFIRKGQVGDWTNHFSKEQSQQMDQLCQEKCGTLGLHFDYD